MRRLIAFLALLGLVVTGCSSEPNNAASPDTTGTVTTAPGSASTVASDGVEPTTTAPSVTTTTSDRPMAPDFTLELGEGGTYTLSESSKPVYLVFWAEW